MVVRKDLPVSALVPNPDNPNKMTGRQFDLLVDNVQRMGFTDPILVRPLDDGTYRIVGGHHRYDAAVYLDYEEVPCSVIDDPEFDEEAERFQMVRHNVIRGQFDPAAFFDLYQQMADKYADDVLQEAFGFAEEKEFKRLIDQTAKSIDDPGMREKFREAAREIRTIDGLSRVLNELFSKYGDTVPYGFMVFDYGGRRSVWVEARKDTMRAFDKVADLCIEHRRLMDDIVGGVLQSIAQGYLDELVEKLVEKSPEVKLPKNLSGHPTRANVEDAETDSE